MTIRELIKHADGTQEIRERELTPEEEADWLNPPQPEPEPVSDDISADEVLEILTGGADDDEG